MKPIRLLVCAVCLLACGDTNAPDPDGGRGPCATNADCSDGVFCNGAEECRPGAPDATDRGCAPASAPRCPTGITCVEAEERCDMACEDADMDGHLPVACGGGDCDDADANRFPGNLEVCDAEGVDEDCDPNTLGPDGDGDSEVPLACCNTQPDGSMRCGLDCNDDSREVNSEASEICNAIDEDCDGAVDEGVLIDTYPDADRDGWGDADAAPMPLCTIPSARSDRTGDCDEADDSIFPTADDTCDGIDQDCDGAIDEAGDAECQSESGNPHSVCLQLVDTASPTCHVVRCGTEASDCNDDGSDGCEARLCTDLGACGRCGTTCTSCSDGLCTFCDGGSCSGEGGGTLSLRGSVVIDGTVAAEGARAELRNMCPGGTTTVVGREASLTNVFRTFQRSPTWRYELPGHRAAVGYADEVDPGLIDAAVLYPEATVASWPVSSLPGTGTVVLQVRVGDYDPFAMGTGCGALSLGQSSGPMTALGSRSYVIPSVTPGMVTPTLTGGCGTTCVLRDDRPIYLDGDSVLTVRVDCPTMAGCGCG